VIEIAVFPAVNGGVPLDTGDVFRFACQARFEGDGLKKYDNPPIFEDETGADLFVEAINVSGQWVSSLPQGEAAVIHVLGENAKQIVAEKMVLRTKTPGQYVRIG
jgi:hypothetical protein